MVTVRHVMDNRILLHDVSFGGNNMTTKEIASKHGFDYISFELFLDKMGYKYNVVTRKVPDDCVEKYISEYQESLKEKEATQAKPVESISQAQKQLCQNNPQSNGIASFLKVMAWLVLIFGIIVGIVISVSEEEGVYFIIYFGSAFLAFSVFLGLSEIINLLHQINNK